MSDQHEAPKPKLKLSSLSSKADPRQPEIADKAPHTDSENSTKAAAPKPRLAFSPKAKATAEVTPPSSPATPAEPAAALPPSPSITEKPAEVEASTPAAAEPAVAEPASAARRIAIKRKVVAETEVPAAAAPPTEPTSTPAVVEEKPKLGLKSKNPTEVASTEAATPEAASSQSGANTDAPEAKVGLKTKAQASTPAKDPASPLKAKPQASTEVQEPTPQRASAPQKNQPSPPELPEAEGASDSSDSGAPASSRSNVVTSVIIILVLFCILAAAAGGIWFVLKDMGEPQVTASSAHEAAPTATEAENNTGGFNLAAPINQAKATIAKVPVMDLEVIEAEKEPQQLSEPIIVRPEPASAPVPASTEAEAAALPSYKEAVTYFLSNAYIGGVRNGANAKVIIDGRSHTIGSIVDQKTSLTFLGTREGRLIFRDGNSVIYVKSF